MGQSVDPTLETLLASAGQADDTIFYIYPFTRWRFQRQFVSTGCNFVKLKSQYRKKLIDRESVNNENIPHIVLKFNSTALVSKEEKRAKCRSY